jgi:hypothetical protein
MEKEGHMRRYLLLLPALVLAVALAACTDLGGRPALKFGPEELPEAQVGQPYTVTLTVSGAQTPMFSFAADPAALPPGLTWTYTEGDTSALLSGVPTTAGDYQFTASAACVGTNVSGQGGEHTYKLKVK